MGAQKGARKDVGTWVFYVVFIMSLLFEATLVRVLGFWLGFVVLMVGGTLFGIFSYVYTDPDSKARDPFFRVSMWCIRRQPLVGYLVLGIFLGGAPGTAIACKKLNSRNTLSLTFLSAFLFALAWASIFSL